MKDGGYNGMHHSEPAHPYTHTATVSPPEELDMLTIAGASERMVWGQENLECDLFADVVGAVLASIRRPGVPDAMIGLRYFIAKRARYHCGILGAFHSGRECQHK
jgi:hypothetical protein